MDLGREEGPVPRDRSIIRYLPAGVTALLALFLFWAPLPFASVLPWSESLLDVAAFALLAAAVLVTPRRADLLPVAVPALCFCALALLGALQARAWSPGVVASLSPVHAQLYREVAGMLPDGAPKPHPTLSLAPAVSRRTALELAALAALLVTAVVVGRKRRQRRWLAAAVVASALFQVLYGARRWVVRATTIWGEVVPGDGSRLRGTFVNPNHLALYLGIALALVFAWLWWSVERARREPGLEQRLILVLPPAIVWLTLFAGLAFSRSRAGLAAAVVGVVVQGLLAVRLRRRWRAAPLALLALAVGFGVVAAVGFEAGLGRLFGPLAYDFSWNGRKEIFQATLELWLRFPWTGSGLGTFREAFPMVQTASVEGTVMHAHNDWLELLATGGLVGTGLLLLGLAALLFRLSRGLRRGARSEDRAAALAALGAVATVAVHEAFDFGLTMPANAFTLVALMGAAAAVRLRAPAGSGRGSGSGGGGGDELHRARKHPASREGDELQEVEPGPDLDSGAEPAGGGRHEGAQATAVQAQLHRRSAFRHFAQVDRQSRGRFGGEHLEPRLWSAPEPGEGGPAISP